jgi:hypothetical protein
LLYRLGKETKRKVEQIMISYYLASPNNTIG